MKTKCLAVGIILLFIGVAVIPSINFTVVKASNDNDLVEVTTQACGINGFGNTTVKLTRQQYQNLEQYLVDFRARLNQTTTRGEAVPIFKEAVVELNKYGLLPRGMSVERGQRLVMGRYQNTRLFNQIEKTSFVNRINDSNNSNYLCLVCSVTDFTFSVGPVYRLIDKYFETDYIINLLNSLYENGHIIMFTILSVIDLFIASLLFYPYLFGAFITSLNPFQIFYTITLGSYSFNPYLYEYQYYPSTGWVATFGLNGIRIFDNQPLWGALPIPPIHTDFMYEEDSYPGIFGFTGINIIGRTTFKIGTALLVEISSEPPS